MRHYKTFKKSLYAATLSLAIFSGHTVAQHNENSNNEKTTIRVMANAAFANTWQTNIVPEFNKHYPNIEVIIDGVPYNEHMAKLMLEATSTNPGYDVLVIDDPWTPQLAELGALFNLKGPEISEITAEDYDWDDINAAPLAAGEWNEIQYSIPVRSNMLLMFYNRKHYKHAQLPEPTPQITWDEFFDQAPKLVQDMNRDGNTDAWAVDTHFVRDQLTPTVWQAIMNSNGGSLLKEDGQPAFNNDLGVEALDIHKRLLKYAPPGALSHGLQEPIESFRQGSVATMFMWGSVFKSSFDRKVSTLDLEDIGLQLFPNGTNGPSTHRGIWTAGISSKTEHLDAAWKFLQWMTSKDGEKANVALAGSFPARKSTLANAEEDWEKIVFPVLQEAYEVAEAGQMWRIRSPRSDATQQVLADEIARGLAGQVDSEDAMKTAAQRVGRILKR